LSAKDLFLICIHVAGGSRTERRAAVQAQGNGVAETRLIKKRADKKGLMKTIDPLRSARSLLTYVHKKRKRLVICKLVKT
jgi:hypothetical protein